MIRRMVRDRISDDYIASAITEVSQHLGQMVRDKGDAAFVSSHEILGKLAEEFQEYMEAVRQNNYNTIRKELIDIGVIVLFGLAGLNEGLTECK